MTRRAAGFTLIEVLAATLLTAGVVAGASALYIQLSDASNRATERTAEGRHATAVLDRVARDLEGARLLVKPADVADRLSFPWLFFAEERYSTEGADRLRFVVSNHVPRQLEGRSADLAIVSYALRPSESGGYELLRWVSPGLPPSLDRDIPDDDRAASVLADGIAEFSTRFMTADGQWAPTWDSTGLVAADELPIAAEVRVALLDREAFEQSGEELPGPAFARSVLIPVRPLDLAAEIGLGAGDGAAGDEDEEAEEDEDLVGGDEAPEDCSYGTWAECAARNAAALDAAGISADQALQLLGVSGGGCADQGGMLAGVPFRCGGP